MCKLFKNITLNSIICGFQLTLSPTSSSVASGIYFNTSIKQLINRTWFYFGVKGTEKDEVLRFTIKNMNHQSRLYASGLRPVMRLGKQGKWKRQQGKISWIVSHNYFQVIFIKSTPEGT